MNKRIITSAIVVVIGLAAVYGIYTFQTDRISPERLREMREAEKRVEAADNEEILLAKAEPEEQKEETTAAEPAEVEIEGPPLAPEDYLVKFDTSKGEIVVRVNHDWAPIGADHFKELVEEKYYDDAIFFRVVPGFVVQFGIAADPEMSARWMDKKLPVEEPKVKMSNKRGTVTYAMGQSPATRSTQVFINLVDNARLDGMGFVPFGEVVQGMDVVEKLESRYGESITKLQGAIAETGNEFLDTQFPGLDRIEKAVIAKAKVKAPAEGEAVGAPAPAPGQ